MTKIHTRLLSELPKPVSAFLRSFRRSFRGYLDRIVFPFWLIFQFAMYRRKAVIIWRTAALGDIVCTLPLCCEIRKRHPARLLIYVTLRGGYNDVVRLSQTVDLVYGINHDYGESAWVVSTARYLPGLVDQVYEPRTIEEREGSKTGAEVHLIDDLASSCGFTLTDRQPRLFPSRKLIEKVVVDLGLSEDLAKGRRLIAINGGHTWPVREWEAAKWQKIVDMIHAEYDAVILQLGVKPNPTLPDEYDQIRGVRSLIGVLPMEHLVALIAGCHLVVSIDSGPVHIAGAVGTPVVGLYGAVNPLYRLPPDSPSMGVASDVPCLFCHHRTPVEHWKTGCPHDIRCMKLLDAQAVYQAVQTMLSKREKMPVASAR